MTSPTGPETERPFDGTRGLALLGIAYLAAGVGLYSGIAVDSTTLILPSLAAILVLVFVSLYVGVRREGLVTAENGVIGACVGVAMALLLGLRGYTDLPSEIVMGAVVFVGVIVPAVYLEFTDHGHDG